MVSRRLLLPALGLIALVAASVLVVLPSLNSQPTPTPATLQPPTTATLSAPVADTPTAAVPTLDVTPTFITAIAPGFTPITRNADWTPQYQTFNGVEMALVPVGCFIMGSESGEEDEIPVHQQCFDQPFWIDRTEVTNAQYGSSGAFSGNNKPRDSMTWFESRDFCAQRGGRLPTEREWEYAARGPNNLIYPWGNDFIADNVVYSGNSSNQSADVGSRPAGDSWVGASDLSGNLWEWVSSIYQQYPYKADDRREANNDNADVLRSHRGGSLGDDVSNLHASSRNYRLPSFGGNGGFRCVRAY